MANKYLRPKAFLLLAIILMSALNISAQISDEEWQQYYHLRDSLKNRQVDNYARHEEILTNHMAYLLTRGRMEGFIEDVENQWENLFQVINNELNISMFDLGNEKDETHWRKVLGFYITGLTIVGDLLESGPELYYNLALLQNNFIDLQRGKKENIIHWEEVQRMLSSNEVAIEIQYLPNKILILGNDGTPVAIEIPEELIKALENYDYSDYISISQFHGESTPLKNIIQLGEPYLKGKERIFLSTSNIYNRFNWAILPYKEGYLQDYFDVIRLFSTADIQTYKSKEQNITDIQEAILIGGLNYDEPGKIYDLALNILSEKDIEDLTRKGYEFLPYSFVEIKQIEKLLENEHITIKTISGNGATNNSLNFMEECPRILHIATHGFDFTPDFIDNGYPALYEDIMKSTGLLLSNANVSSIENLNSDNQGIITAYQLSQKHLENVELAVLSSCSSGLGDINNLTGLTYGPAHALKTEGVKTIIISLWDLKDEVTSLAMPEFYKNYLKRENVRESLKLMQDKLKEMGYKDVYYWGAFDVIE